METNLESSRADRAKRARGRGVLLAALLCAWGLVANVASAQTTEHETAGQTVREEVREAHWHHPRLRLGISGLGGGFFGAIHGGAGGLALRVGVQLNDLVAVYLQGQGLIGEYVPDPRPTSLVGLVFHSAILEVTLLDTIQLGAGPSIDAVWGCSAANDGAWCGRSGAFFGGDFRAAIIAFHRGAEHRHGIVFSIDAHPTWLDRELVTTMLFGIGGEMY